MSRTVDDKVVAMSFEHSKFESGVNSTLSALDKLKAALHFPGASKGLDGVNAAAQRINLGHIASAIDGIKQKFSAMNVVALSVLANIANRAISAGANLVKSLTLGPITGGLKEYETNLNSVQTILANTQASGATLKDVNAALDELNHYSDKTIYNFSEMAKNIGTFTAAGVDLDTATGAIKGIANLAAVSGSNSQQASTAMYQLSQAIAAGRVSLQDWNSVVNAGMGGTVFQRALATTAENMGTLSDGSVKLTGKMKNVSIAGESFRESIQAKPGKESWLTSEVLTKTLEQFTGDMTDAELAAQGFTKAQIEAIQSQAKTAVKAATEVKTLSGVLDTARESAGSGWAKTWQIIFGDFGEAKELFTGVSEAVNGFIEKSAEARNKVLGDWKKLGGRTIAIEGIKNIFTGLGTILKPIKEAFRDIFPPATGKTLLELTRTFTRFTATIQIGPAAAENLKRTFKGVFALFSIGKQIVSGIFGVFKRLFGVLGEGDSNFLDFTGNIGDFIVAIDKAMKSGEGLGKFFDQIGDALEAPVRKIKEFVSGLFGLGTAFDGTAAAEGFLGILENIGSALKPIVSGIGEAFSSIGDALAESLSTANFDNVMEVVKTGLLGGIFLTIRNFMKKDLPGAGLLDSISGSFDALTGKLTAMQNNVKADTLQKIAIAVGILAASMFALSFIDPERLAAALTAMTVAFGQLLGAMALLSTISTSGFLKVPFIAASLILLATAVGILTIAVRNLSGLGWEELAKGLIGVGVLLAALSASAKVLSANSAGMVQAGVGILAIAFAMKVLASAVRDFGSMSWTEIGKGLGSVAVALGAIGLASKLFPPGMVGIGVGLIAVAGALNILAMAVAAFGEMSWETLGKGMASIAVSLGLIVGAMVLMPPNMPAISAGLLLVAAALLAITQVVKLFGGMSIETLAKGIGAMAASLVVLGLAMYGMIGTMPGAAALAVAAASIMLLAPAMERLGKQSWGEILKGTVALAAALTVLGIAGVLLAPVAPALLGLGAAITLIGAGLALAGAGIFLAATGLSALAVAGPAAIAVLVASLISFAEAVPRVAEAFIAGFLRIVDQLVEVAPKFISALLQIIVMLVNAIVASAPRLGEAFTSVILTAIEAFEAITPKLISAGIKFLDSLLKGIKQNITKVTTAAMDILAKFLTAIANNLAKVQKAGADLLGKFISGLGTVYGKIISAGGDVVAKVLKGISDAASKITTAATNLITRFISSLGTAATRLISAGASMISRILEGIGNSAGRVVSKAVEVAGKFMTTLARESVKLVDTGATAIINFLNGVAGVIRARGPEMRSAGVNIATAIIQGFVSGLNAGDVVSAVIRKFRGAVEAGKRAVGAKSPSTEFIKIGQYVNQGFAIGVGTSTEAQDAIAKMAYGIINGTKAIFGITSPSTVMKDIGKFVGKGFAEGLLGSVEDIDNAFTTMQEKLTEAMVAARESIRENEDRLDKLRKAKKKDISAINDAETALKKANQIYNDSKAVRAQMTKDFADEHTQLKILAQDYAKVSEDLDKATKGLEDAIKTRDDFNTQITGKFGALPELDQEAKDQLGTYKETLTKQINAVGAYQSVLAQLRAQGLDDKTYQMLLDEGTAGQKFAEQLLAGGPDAIASVNSLSSSLTAASSQLGRDASQGLYQAGVDAAQGLVNGLTTKKSDVYKAMEAIATEMIKAIKKKLKIKSPSQVFAEIGKFSIRGMTEGLITSSKLVTEAASSVGQDALDAMKRSMSHISELIDVDANPKITPVLDLSQLSRDAAGMASIFDNVVPITAAASYGQAAAISAARFGASADAEVATAGSTPSIAFYQTNTSPKALSEVDIFRQTKNQLAQAKKILT